MHEKYIELNEEAREYFINLLDIKAKDKNVLNRCKKEVDLLYNKGLLFIIEFLYKFKKYEKSARFHFRGMANNLLLLYVLGISKVDPVKYNLPYELFTDKSLCIDFIGWFSLEFIEYIERNTNSFRIVKGSFNKCDVEEINRFNDNHYLVIPSGSLPSNMTFKLNKYNQFETIEDYNQFNDDYIIIRLDDKPWIYKKDVDIKNAMHTEFEEEVSKYLKPKTIDDYVKVISLAHGTMVWQDNQDKLFKDKKIKISNIISNREDVYEYLIEHHITPDVALNIVKQMFKVKDNKPKNAWNEYVKIMRKHNCDEMIINIFSKILYIFGRGQAVSECLYALDEDNYFYN